MADEHDVEIAKCAVEATKIIQEQQTKRQMCTWGSVLAGLTIVGATAIQLTTPAWITVFTVVMGTLFSSGGLVMVLLKVYMKNVEKNHRRIAELEQEKDPERTSSAPSPPALPEDKTNATERKDSKNE